MTIDNKLTDITKSLGFIMINTSWKIKDELRKAFLADGYDLTIDQYAVLIRLWTEDGLSQTELSERTLKSKSNLTRILDSMEKKGLIFRQISKNDRRKFSIFLTENGRGLKDELMNTAIKMNNKIFDDITYEDQNNLLRILTHISKNIQ